MGTALPTGACRPRAERRCRRQRARRLDGKASVGDGIAMNQPYVHLRLPRTVAAPLSVCANVLPNLDVSTTSGCVDALEEIA